MTKILRTEEWTKEIGWGISTLLVTVYAGEVVHASEDIVKELALDPEDYSEGVDFERFYREVPYLQFKDAILRDGLTYAGTT